jgi:hypothetical protein
VRETFGRLLERRHNAPAHIPPWRTRSYRRARHGWSKWTPADLEHALTLLLHLLQILPLAYPTRVGGRILVRMRLASSVVDGPGWAQALTLWAPRHTGGANGATPS